MGDIHRLYFQLNNGFARMMFKDRGFKYLLAFSSKRGKLYPSYHQITLVENLGNSSVLKRFLRLFFTSILFAEYSKYKIKRQGHWPCRFMKSKQNTPLFKAGMNAE